MYTIWCYITLIQCYLFSYQNNKITVRDGKRMQPKQVVVIKAL